MQTLSYKLKGLAQANLVLTRSNSAVIAQLSHMTVKMNDMQVQLKILELTTTKPTRTKRKFYSWICGRNVTYGSRNLSYKKMDHKEEAHYKKRLDGIKKG